MGLPRDFAFALIPVKQRRTGRSADELPAREREPTGTGYGR